MNGYVLVCMRAYGLTSAYTNAFSVFRLLLKIYDFVLRCARVLTLPKKYMPELVATLVDI